MAAPTSSVPTRVLFITGIPKADALLNSNGTALLIGMLLDQQVPMEWAFTGPHTIKQRLGHCDASKIAAMDEEKFVSICCEKPAIHRFPASMAKRIHQMCVILTTEYKGKGSNVWKKIENAEELRKRLRQLPGYGEEKTEIFIALLG
ncbi:MAG: Fe-S cluster assembly protein HesB, partial [Acidimicrobiia bacterium BACL6 MAG-121220-bin61]